MTFFISEIKFSQEIVPLFRPIDSTLSNPYTKGVYMNINVIYVVEFLAFAQTSAVVK